MGKVKMKSQKDLTGLTSTEQKLLKLYQRLLAYFDDHKTEFTEEYLKAGESDVKITRHEIRNLISSALHITNRDTVSLWINTLLGEQSIIQNPNSHILKVNDERGEIIMPNLNTKYFINPVIIEQYMDELRVKVQNFNKKKTCTHPPYNNTLDKY